MADESAFRLTAITLDERSIVRRTREIEQERDIAIYDLLEGNSFRPEGSHGGPYKLVLGVEENRLTFDIAQQPRRAVLYVAGQDTPAAWFNGRQILQAQPLPPWKQMPWKTYTSHDVTAQLRGGKNILAIEIVHYIGRRQEAASQTPMNAALYLEAADGSATLLKSEPRGWRATLDAAENWYAPAFDDAQWKEAIAYHPGTINLAG